MSTVEPDSVRAIAKKDFQDAVRSYLFWGLSAFFFLLMAVAAYATSWAFDGDISTQNFVFFLSQVTKVVIPLIALLLGWKAIAGERETGSIKVLLSLPHSRYDVILGKLLGRTGVLSVSLLIGFAIAGVVVAFTLNSFSIGEYVGFLAMTVLYALAYVSITVALSSIARSTTIAAALVFGVFVLFYIVWNTIQIGLQTLMQFDYIEGRTVNMDGGGQFERLPDWALFIDTLDPGSAYQNALTVASTADDSSIGTQFQSAMFPDGIPFYLQDWFSFVILLFWIVVPLAVALYRFDRVDI